MAQSAGLVYIVLFSWLVQSGKCQGIAYLTLSTNPVYTGELFILTCNYGSGRLPVSVTIDAINGTQKIGSLSCKTPSRNTTGTGIFSGKHFEGCPLVPPNSKNVSLAMTAHLSLQISFKCTAIVTDVNSNMLMLESGPTPLRVNVLPTIPQITPNPGVFDEDDNATVKCESYNGTPTSMLRLTVSLPSGNYTTAIGNEITFMRLPLPVTNWHNAVANCVVTNHNFENMSATSIIAIIHIKCITQPPDVTQNNSRTVLNCSKYVSSYPSPIYSWSLAPELNVTNSSFLRGSNFDVANGHSGSINCTVTNNVTMRTAVVGFSVGNSQDAQSHDRRLAWNSSGCFLTPLTNLELISGHYLSSRETYHFSLKEKLWTAIPSVLGCVFGAAAIVLCIKIRIINKKGKIAPA